MLNITKALCLAAMATLLSACNLMGGGAKADGTAAAASVMGSIVQARVKQKGPQMFCSQPTYQKCLGQEEAACVAEQQTFSDTCFTTAQNLSGGEGVSSAAFASHYASCMTVKHGLMHPDRAFEIKSCLAEAKFDYAAMLRSILY